MKYYRVHSADIAFATKQPRGIFTVIAKLDQAKLLTEEETAEYMINHEYFEKILPVPPFYSGGNTMGAVTWFKDVDKANDVYSQMTFYRKMAAKYGVRLYISECEDIPGEIIYEDEYQIAVVGQRTDIEIKTREI